jgi:phospholipid-binding lipoprotein MlaA
MSANIRYSKNSIGFMSKALGQLLVSMTIVLVYGCASTEVIEQNNPHQNTATKNPVDPYENFNRKMYNFNDKVDNYVAEPISNAYKWVTPQFVQTGVFNFFNNLKNINVVLNDVFQAKFAQSAQDTGRFAMNTTLGIGGLFDVAKHVGLEQNDEDFEQTLAVWGVPQGSYLVLPFLGPSTARGIPGSIFDTAANPTTYVGLPVQLLSMLNTRANAEGSLKFIDEAALDPYVFTRESFLQWRNNLAQDGKTQAVSDFDDELEEENGSANSTSNEQKPAAAPEKTSANSAESNNSYSQASEDFGSASQSFENTAKSFEEASNKLNIISNQKKTRRSANAQ